MLVGRIPTQRGAERKGAAGFPGLQLLSRVFVGREGPHEHAQCRHTATGLGVGGLFEVYWYNILTTSLLTLFRIKEYAFLPV
jgi:hypothetical protein